MTLEYSAIVLTCKFPLFQASLRGKTSEFDAYVLMLHKNALQVLVPTIGQQLTLYLDKREKKKEEKKKHTKEAEPMEVDETPAPQFEFNEKVMTVFEFPSSLHLSFYWQNLYHYNGMNVLFEIALRYSFVAVLQKTLKFDCSCVLQELFVKCGSVIIRPFDHLKIQVTVDTSDVQHQRVVSKLIEPVIPGFSVPSLKRESSESKETTSKKRKK